MVGSCNRCGRQIYAAWRTANERHYHPHCFTCAICDSIILSTTNLEASDLKEIYCLGCFDQYFKNQEGGLLKQKDSCRPVMTKKYDKDEGQCDNLKSYINPEESLKAVNLERSPHSPHIRSHAKYSQERSGKKFKESIEEVIKDADSYSERLKKSTCAPTPIFLMKREDSNSDIQPAFTSRIPRLKSLLKIPLKMTIPDPKFEPVCSDAKKRQDIERHRSFIRSADSKPPSSKMSDYLNSKGIKFNELSTRTAFPMKAKHSAASFTLNMKPSFPRSMSTPAVVRSRKYQQHPSSTTSIQNATSISNAPQHPNAPPMSTSHLDVDGPKASTVLQQPDSCSNAPEVSETQLIQKQKDVPSTISIRTGSRSFITLNNTKPKSKPVTSTNTQNVLPSCKQLLSIIMKPKAGNNYVSNHTDTSLSTPEEAASGMHGSICRKSRNRNDPLNCQICFESLTMELDYPVPGKSLENSVTGCGHVFHRECISKWLGTAGNNGRCPICSTLCKPDSLIPVYLEANVAVDQNAKESENGELESLLVTLRFDYKELSDKYIALVNEHSECNVKSAVTSSLRSAYEMECQNRVELQWENKRLKRQIEELRALIPSPQGDSVIATFQ